MIVLPKKLHLNFLNDGPCRMEGGRVTSFWCAFKPKPKKIGKWENPEKWFTVLLKITLRFCLNCAINYPSTLRVLGFR